MGIEFDLWKDKDNIQLLEKCECVSMFVQLNSVIDMLCVVHEFMDLADKTTGDISPNALAGLAKIVREQMDNVYRLCLMLYPKNDKNGALEMKQEARFYYS